MPGLLPARIAAALLLLVVAFQVALVVGAPWGSWTQGGSHSGSLPGDARFFAATSAMLLVVMALSILARVGHGPFVSLPRPLQTFLAWATTVYAGISVLLNLVTPSGSERALFAPVALVTFVCCVLTLRATRRPDSAHTTTTESADVPSTPDPDGSST